MQHEANTNFAWDPSADSQKLLLYSVVERSHKEGVYLNESVVNRGRSMQPFNSPARPSCLNRKHLLGFSRWRGFG